MKNINRSLGAMEKTFLLLDQISQVHFVIAAEIIGTKTISEWREALNALQHRHPFLSVYIKNNGFVHPSFQDAGRYLGAFSFMRFQGRSNNWGYNNQRVNAPSAC